MIRRCNFASSNLARASNGLGANKALQKHQSFSMAAVPATTAQRNYVGPMDPWCSLFMCFFVTAAGASWGNTIHSISKHGLFRHNMQIDSPFVVEGNRLWQYAGGFLGFLMYWFVVGPMKYTHAPDMNKWAKRFGNSPF